jgi:hypothetical protein
MSAQEWQLPELGAVEYRRTCEAGVSAVCRSATAARAAELASRVPERLIPRVVPAPWLCQGELDSRQQTPVGPVRDLRDVLQAVALDLRMGGGRGKFVGVVPYGDLAVSGSWRAAKAGGDQELRATIRGRPPSDKRLRTFCCQGCTGKITMSRRFDAAQKIVESFRGEIDLVIDEGHRQFRRLRVSDAWTFVAVRDNQDVDFWGSGLPRVWGFGRNALVAGWATGRLTG